MTIRKKIEDHCAGHIRIVEWVSRELAGEIERCASLMSDALGRGKKLLVMGNGGSAADAQHLAAELVGRFLRERSPLPAIALTTDSSILTAVGNDFGFDQIFRRQVEALAVPGDIVLGISTSGRSNNVFQALTAANGIGCTTIALLGRDGGNIAGLADVALTVEAEETPFIQEAHLTIIHILCDLLENALFPANPV
jgi:D-sedoheptulose 7-phosphate isomerase